MCIMFTIIMVITTYYITSTNDYNIDIQTLEFRHGGNGSHLPLPRIFCFILTAPKNLLTRAKAINETWGPRCDRYFFVTEYPRANMTQEQINISEQMPIAPIKNITPGYDHLTQKSVLAFLFAYENYINDFDWFVKADDDTYLLVDNLRAFLSDKNSSDPVTFGYNFKVINADLRLSCKSILCQKNCYTFASSLLSNLIVIHRISSERHARKSEHYGMRGSAFFYGLKYILPYQESIVFAKYLCLSTFYILKIDEL